GCVEYTQKKHIGVDFHLLIDSDESAQTNGAETHEGTQCGEKIARAASQIAIDTAGVTGRFGIQAHPAPAGVEPLLTVSSASQSGIEKTGLAIQKKVGSKEGVLGQANGSGQVIPTASRNHAQNDARSPCKRVYKHLESSITAEHKDPLASLRSPSARLCSEVLRALRGTKLDQPAAAAGKVFERGENILSQPSARGGVDKNQVRNALRGRGEFRHRLILLAEALFDCQSFPGIRTKWCRRGESNPRPRDYETLALPLSYAGVKQFFMLRSNRGECQACANSVFIMRPSRNLSFGSLTPDKRGGHVPTAPEMPAPSLPA